MQVKMLSASLFLTVVFSVLHSLGAKEKRFDEDCPKHYKRVKVVWMEYFSSYIEEHNDTTTGWLPIALDNSLKRCCKKLPISWGKIQTEKHTLIAEETENYSTNDTITLLFPVLAGKDATTAFHIFPFLPLKNSPGPMVLATLDSLTITNFDGTSLVNLVQNPLFLLSLAMTASAAAIFWLVVRIYNIFQCVFN